MTHIEQKDTMDIVIALQYVIAQVNDISEVQNIVSNMKACIDNGEMSIQLLLQILLASLPSLVCTSNIIIVVESILELKHESKHESAIFDILTIFESYNNNDSNDVKIPKNIQRLISLGTEKKQKLVADLNRSNDIISNKYNFLIDSNANDATIFQTFMKAIIFRLNDEFSSFSVTNSIVMNLKNSKYADLELLDWIKTFYIPLEILTPYINTNYSLLDYENYLTLEEKIDLIMSQIYDTSKVNNIVNNVLLPIIKYYCTDAWNYLNGWISNFGKKCVQETENNKIISNYNILLHLLREEQLLNELNHASKQIKNAFVTNILTTLYLCPKANLQVFINAKEMLILLQSLDLPEVGSKKLADIKVGDFDDVSKQFSATKATIESMMNIIQVGEILYSNELSIVDVIHLKNATRHEQYEQLVKYITNEVTYETSIKKWQLFLKSIDSTLTKTNVFNKISHEELSDVILSKLFELKQYKVIKDIFEKEFNHIPNNEYQNLISLQCWKLYMNASNCDPKIGQLKDCLDCLSLLNETSKDYQKLTSLIKANERLLDWKFFIKSGIPVSPKSIVEINNPLTIVRRILELNYKAYMYCGDLYYIAVLLIEGLDVSSQNPLFKFSNKTYDDKTNLLAVKLKLLCLEYASPVDHKFSFDLAYQLLSVAIQEKHEIDELFDLVSENWFLFFQLSKNEYDDIPEYDLIDNKLKLLGQILLIAPTGFNTNVLEQWQMLNAQKDHITSNISSDNGTANKDNTGQLKTSLGDVQARLQRSLKSSAEEIMNTNGSDIGKNIIGWIVGAN